MPAAHASKDGLNATSTHVRPILNSGHIPALDAIRGLAILAVTLYRFRLGPDDGSLASEWLTLVLSHGRRGVDLFFVLSGFLITGILYDAKPKSHYFRNFYARRALRIFPLYYGVLVAALVLLPLVWTRGYPYDATREVQGWLWGYGTNVVISWRGQWCFGYFDHFWSLAVEEHFYLVWPLLIYFSPRIAAQRWCIGLALASAGARVACAAFTDNGPAVEVLTLFKLDALLVGAWFALVARGPQGLAGLVPSSRWILVLSGALLLPEVLLSRRLFTVLDSLYALFFGATIVLAVTARESSPLGKVWRSRLLQWLGRYSYGMYVFQFPLIPLLALAFTAESLQATLGSALGGRLAYITLMFAATTGAAYASWHLYERHFLAGKRYFVGQSQEAGGAHAKTSVQAIAAILEPLR